MPRGKIPLPRTPKALEAEVSQALRQALREYSRDEISALLKQRRQLSSFQRMLVEYGIGRHRQIDSIADLQRAINRINAYKAAHKDGGPEDYLAQDVANVLQRYRGSRPKRGGTAVTIEHSSPATVEEIAAELKKLEYLTAPHGVKGELKQQAATRFACSIQKIGRAVALLRKEAHRRHKAALPEK